MASLDSMVEHCPGCNEQLELGRIGRCDGCEELQGSGDPSPTPGPESSPIATTQGDRMNFVIVMADGKTYWAGGPNPYTTEQKYARSFNFFADAKEVAERHPGARILPVNERALRERTAEVVRRACLDAMDFGTALQSGYVLACWEVVYASHNTAEDERVIGLSVRERLAKLGFDF